MVLAVVPAVPSSDSYEGTNITFKTTVASTAIAATSTTPTHTNATVTVGHTSRKAHGKHETTHKQKKQQFEDAWFGQVIKGQGWEQMQMAEWSAIPHITRVAFTYMVLARRLFLRPNEFCEMMVARHSDFRPWSRASVTFWAGEKRIRVSADGIPDQSQFFNLTEVRLRDQPSKSNRAGDRAPFV